MNKTHPSTCIVIPSLDPSPSLIAYVQALNECAFSSILVVNDGSSAAYDHIFETISTLPGCTVLTHAQNQGKGAALKTAYAHIAQHCPHITAIVTADSDGQHAVKDVCRMADTLADMPTGLLLGGRDFSQAGVPMKSWVGNRLSALTFFLLHGAWVSDTQTGLRGFGRSLLPQMQAIQGDRFQYEMGVLVTCAREKIPMKSISIDTIYIEGNASSHFRPLQDSVQIGRVLLARLGRFSLSAGLSSLVDILLCWALLGLLTGVIASDFLRIGTAIVLARLVSMGVNYGTNKGFVFQTKQTGRAPFVRYFALAILNMVALTILVFGAHAWLGMSERLSTIVFSAVLFVVNFQVQRVWVFPTNQTILQKGGAL